MMRPYLVGAWCYLPHSALFFGLLTATKWYKTTRRNNDTPSTLAKIASWTSLIILSTCIQKTKHLKPYQRYCNIIETLRFFVFERTKHQPRRNLHSYLALQRLCKKQHLAPALMHFGTKSWSKMVVSWCYANLSMEWSRHFSVANA